jgi:hypothetical protein
MSAIGTERTSQRAQSISAFASKANIAQNSEPNGPNDNVNQLMALACELPKNLQIVDGGTDVYGDGSVTLVSTPPATRRAHAVDRTRAVNRRVHALRGR